MLLDSTRAKNMIDSARARCRRGNESWMGGGARSVGALWGPPGPHIHFHMEIRGQADTEGEGERAGKCMWGREREEEGQLIGRHDSRKTGRRRGSCWVKDVVGNLKEPNTWSLLVLSNCTNWILVNLSFYVFDDLLRDPKQLFFFF